MLTEVARKPFMDARISAAWEHGPGGGVEREREIKKERVRDSERKKNIERERGRKRAKRVRVCERKSERKGDREYA